MGRLTLLAVALLVALPTTAPAAIVQNGRFTESAGGMPVGWRLEAWAKDLTEAAWEPSTDGAGLVRIENRGPNDARVCQTVDVYPGASYRVTARVKTANVGPTTAGALIAIEPRIADSVDIKGTQDWQTLEVSASNADAATWDICLRLGSYANLNTGTAWFTDVRVEALSGAPSEDGSGRWRLNLAPLLVTFRSAPWTQTAVPLVGGLLLALGLGVVGRRPRS